MPRPGIMPRPRPCVNPRPPPCGGARTDAAAPGAKPAHRFASPIGAPGGAPASRASAIWSQTSGSDAMLSHRPAWYGVRDGTLANLPRCQEIDIDPEIETAALTRGRAGTWLSRCTPAVRLGWYGRRRAGLPARRAHPRQSSLHAAAHGPNASQPRPLVCLRLLHAPATGAPTGSTTTRALTPATTAVTAVRRHAHQRRRSSAPRLRRSKHAAAHSVWRHGRLADERVA
jgi:hypothetical protein